MDSEPSRIAFNMDSIEKLRVLFERFPGIGPRQATRFVQFLLRSSPSLRREIATEIQKLGNNVKQCTECRRFFAGIGEQCTICKSPQRNDALLLIVTSDADVETIERSGNYNGKYFVLGGLLSFGDTNPLPNQKQLMKLLTAKKTIEEIIIAVPANPEGDNTEQFLRSLFASSKHPISAKVATLGRGLSTGSEIEYADAETIKNALENRR